MWRALVLALLVALRVGHPALTAASAMDESCHATIRVDGPTPAEAPQTNRDLDWVLAESPRDRRTLARWCAAVGPAVIVEGASRRIQPADRLTVVSWNMHVGGGDLPALLAALGVHADTREPQPPFVLLLQEVLRGGAAVPPLAAGSRFATRILERSPGGDRADIVEQARDRGLWAAYVPSMRNGRDVNEDRGNAIVSNLPLENIEAIELPAGPQRRVAVAADVSPRSPTGEVRRVRVASVHLDNRGRARQLWIFAGGMRAAQARAAVEALGDSRVAVLGGDFNSWAGFDEAAYRETVSSFPDTRVTDRRPTFAWGLRLDHLFFRLPAGWRARFARLDQRFGSDHYPLAGAVDLSAAAHAELQSGSAATSVR